MLFSDIPERSLLFVHDVLKKNVNVKVKEHGIMLTVLEMRKSLKFFFICFVLCFRKWFRKKTKPIPQFAHQMSLVFFLPNPLPHSCNSFVPSGPPPPLRRNLFAPFCCLKECPNCASDQEGGRFFCKTGQESFPLGQLSWVRLKRFPQTAATANCAARELFDKNGVPRFPCPSNRIFGGSSATGNGKARSNQWCDSAYAETSQPTA